MEVSTHLKGEGRVIHVCQSRAQKYTMKIGEHLIYIENWGASSTQ